MNQNSLNNLKPFTGRNDPRRQNGRKKGSLNYSTLIKNALEEEIDLNLLGDNISEKLKNAIRGKTLLEAVAVATAYRAVAYDNQASNLIFRERRHIAKTEPTGFYAEHEYKPIKFVVVDGRETAERLEAVEKRLQENYDFDPQEVVDEMPEVDRDYNRWLKEGNFTGNRETYEGYKQEMQDLQIPLL
ncbi:MAG: hypothetical protein LBM97_01895 [Candidatus Nomurabacteria bacterium]|jgi:hypothetical protein|nr:hypothetical protein [Candidatus Nomurabacteria bacterium]